MRDIDQKEYKWHLDKHGYISASKLDDLLTSGKKGNSWGQTAITYLYKLQYERLRGFPIVGVDARPMSFGRENEVYANEWLRENVNQAIRSCSTDFEERIFKKVPSAMFGASPDSILGTPENVEHLYEIKCVYGEKETTWMFSPTVSKDKKRAQVLADHRDQLAGQLIAYPECNKISLLKYDAQRDDNPFDTKSPLDISRGILFTFSRADFGDYIKDVWVRILCADAFLNSGYDLDNINEYSFVVSSDDDGIIPGITNNVKIRLPNE